MSVDVCVCDVCLYDLCLCDVCLCDVCLYDVFQCDVCLCDVCLFIRPVGWSGDGGVRETIRVELTSGGGAFPAWGMG